MHAICRYDWGFPGRYHVFQGVEAFSLLQSIESRVWYNLAGFEGLDRSKGAIEECLLRMVRPLHRQRPPHDARGSGRQSLAKWRSVS